MWNPIGKKWQLFELLFTAWAMKKFIFLLFYIVRTKYNLYQTHYYIHTHNFTAIFSLPTPKLQILSYINAHYWGWGYNGLNCLNLCSLYSQSYSIFRRPIVTRYTWIVTIFSYKRQCNNNFAALLRSCEKNYIFLVALHSFKF